jgi:hypothetical protein
MKWLFRLSVLISFGAGSIALSVDAWAKCSVRGTYHLSSEGPWRRSMTIRSGDSCEQTFRAGGTMMFKRLNILTSPRKRTLTLRQGGHYTYKTKADAQGTDSFMLRVCGGQGGREGCANLAFDVNIQPARSDLTPGDQAGGGRVGKR